MRAFTSQKGPGPGKGLPRNISEAEDKLRETFTTGVNKFLNGQKPSGLTAQVNKNTKNVDKLSRSYNFAARQTEVFVKAMNERINKNIKGILKG